MPENFPRFTSPMFQNFKNSSFKRKKDHLQTFAKKNDEKDSEALKASMNEYDQIKNSFK